MKVDKAMKSRDEENCRAHTAASEILEYAIHLEMDVRIITCPVISH